MRQRGSVYLFVPETPLEVGATYEVPATGSFVAAEPLPVELDAIEVELALAVTAEVESVEQLCCEGVPGCGGYCVNLEEAQRTYTGVQLDIRLTSLEAERSEFRWSVTTSSGDTLERFWLADDFVSETFVVTSPEYCVTAEVRSLIDGSTRSFEPVCIEHGELPVPGDKDVVPPDELPDQLLLCPSPPWQGPAEPWCAWASDLCADGDEQACARTAEECGESPGGASSSGGATAAGGGTQESPGGPTFDRQGCAFHAPGRSRLSGGMLAVELVALALCVGRFRRARVAC